MYELKQPLQRPQFNYLAHEGHELTYYEHVAQQWEVVWGEVSGQLVLTEVTDRWVLSNRKDEAHHLYCDNCNVFLEGGYEKHLTFQAGYNQSLL